MLLLIDRVDEWLLSHLHEFDGTPLQSVAKGAVDLGKLQDEDEKKAAAEAQTTFKPILDKLKQWIEREDPSLRFTLNMLGELAAQKTLDYPTASVAVRRLSMLSVGG